MPALRILLLENDLAIQACLRDLLCDEGYEITVSSSPEEGCSLAHQETFDVILADSFRQPGQDPLTALRHLRLLFHPTPVGLITGWDISEETTLEQGFAFLIRKPYDTDQILAALAEALGNQ